MSAPMAEWSFRRHRLTSVTQSANRVVLDRVAAAIPDMDASTPKFRRSKSDGGAYPSLQNPLLDTLCSFAVPGARSTAKRQGLWPCAAISGPKGQRTLHCTLTWPRDLRVIWTQIGRRSDAVITAGAPGALPWRQSLTARTSNPLILARPQPPTDSQLMSQQRPQAIRVPMPKDSVITPTNPVRIGAPQRTPPLPTKPGLVRRHNPSRFATGLVDDTFQKLDRAPGVETERGTPNDLSFCSAPSTSFLRGTGSNSNHGDFEILQGWQPIGRSSVLKVASRWKARVPPSRTPPMKRASSQKRRTPSPAMAEPAEAAGPGAKICLGRAA